MATNDNAVTALCNACMHAFASLSHSGELAVAKATMGERYYDEAIEALRLEVKRALTTDAEQRLEEFTVAPRYATQALVTGIVAAAKRRVLASV